MPNELRPIGTEFWYDFPLDPCCTETKRTKIKYKVIDHVFAQNPTTMKDEIMEELKAIASQYVDE